MHTKKIIAETKNEKLACIKTPSHIRYEFSHISLDKDLVVTPSENLKYNFELYPYTHLPHPNKSNKDKLKAQQKELSEEKQFLIIQLYQCMLRDKKFVLPNFIRYNSRYDKEFNYYTLMVPYELLDAKHVFLKLMYSKFFNHNWKYFFDNYDRLEPYLKNNLSARQMLISFMSEHGKINKLWKNKRFKWIIYETPYFYLRVLRVMRYLDEDNLKEFNQYKQSRYQNLPKELILNEVEVNRLSLKPKPRKKSMYKREKVVIKIGNGVLNPTMNIVNLFNNEPAEIFITNSRTHVQPYSELFNFIYLVNNKYVKFISTNTSLIAYDHKDIVIPNMKYAARILRHFIKCIFGGDLSSRAVINYIEKFTFYLDKIESKRTRKFIKIKLEDTYVQYKLSKA